MENVEETTETSEIVTPASDEAAKMKDQLYRVAAELDNTRKRHRKELEEATRRGKEEAIKGLLSVVDNVERAASSFQEAKDPEAILQGMRIISKQFADYLDRLGLKKIATEAEAFDPKFHEAVQHLESKLDSGIIIQELQAGWQIKDYVVRPALVVVSKGSEK